MKSPTIAVTPHPKPARFGSHSMRGLLWIGLCLAGMSLSGMPSRGAAQEANEPADAPADPISTADTFIDGKTPEERLAAFMHYTATVEQPKTRDSRVLMVYVAAEIYAGTHTASALKQWQ